MGESTEKRMGSAETTTGHTNPLVAQTQSDLLKRLMGSFGSPDSDYGQAMSGAMKSFGEVASGAHLGGSDPYFQRNLDRTISDTKADVNSAFGADGRYGSGLHAQTLADSLGGVRDRAYSTELDNSRDRQVQAAGILPGLQWGDLGAASSILGNTAAASGQTTNTVQTGREAPWWQTALGYVAGNAGQAMRMGMGG